MLKKYVFDYFEAFFIIFEYANACTSMHSLVKIHSMGLLQLQHSAVEGHCPTFGSVESGQGKTKTVISFHFSFPGQTPAFKHHKPF